MFWWLGNGHTREHTQVGKENFKTRKKMRGEDCTYGAWCAVSKLHKFGVKLHAGQPQQGGTGCFVRACELVSDALSTPKRERASEYCPTELAHLQPVRVRQKIPVGLQPPV